MNNKLTIADLRHYSGYLRVAKTFTAVHSNYCCGQVFTEERTFKAGEIHMCGSWRPEGIEFAGMFIHESNIGNLVRASKQDY